MDLRSDIRKNRAASEPETLSPPLSEGHMSVIGEPKELQALKPVMVSIPLSTVNARLLLGVYSVDASCGVRARGGDHGNFGQRDIRCKARRRSAGN